MPLLPLAKLLDATEQTADGDEGPKHTASDAHKTIVIRVNGSHAGITVREIVDVAQQQGPMRLTNEPGHLIRGSAVIEGKVTDILDIDSVLNSFGIAKTSFTGADA